MATPRVVLVQYQVTEDNVLAFVGRDDLAAPYVQRIALSRAVLRDIVGRTFGATPVHRFRTESPLAWSEPLLPLVAFLADWTAPDDTIWFVPHDVLHQVPLHALRLGDGYLVERNAAVYTPSATVLRYAQNMRRPGRTRALVLADSRPDRPLLYAREQAMQVGSLYSPGATLMTGSAANARQLAARAAETPEGLAVLHMACHGEFNQADPEHSGLWLAADDGHDGLLRASDLQKMSLPTNLVMLSACESGLTGRLPGEELLGLTRALLHAGAAAAVVTLWSVDELSTSLFTRAFYERVQAGDGFAVALRAAQLTVFHARLADLLAYCVSTPAGDTAALLALDIAAIHLAAGDTAAALAGYEAIANAEPHGSPRYRLAVRGAATARLKPARPPDYQFRPYRHPYFWAPFFLTGDWR